MGSLSKARRIVEVGALFLILCLVVVMQAELSCFAQENNEKAVDLGKVIVTASRIENSLNDTASAVSIIDSEQLEMSPYERSDDVLRSEAGVDVNYHYGMNSISGTRPVNLRGVGSFGERTLVLIDGMPHNNPYTNWVEWSQIPKEAIERIEVVRGPTSALYGSSGMGGAVNIITRKPVKKSETTLEGQGGSLSTWGARASQELKSNKFGFYLNAKYDDTNGYLASVPEKSWDIKRFRHEKNAFAKITYSADEDSTLTAGYSRYDAVRGCGREFSYENDKDNFGWLAFDRANKTVNWKANFFVKDLKWLSYYDSMPFYNYLYHRAATPILGMGGSLQPSIKFSEANTLTLGLDFLHNEFKIDDEYFTVSRLSQAKGKQFSAAPFLNEQLKFFSERLVVNVGARADFIKAYDGENRDNGASPAYSNYFSSKSWQEFSPKLGVLYKLSDSTILRGSVGRGFRAPSLYEMFVSINHGPTYVECNPDLQPEKITSYDVGLEYGFKNLLAKITFYISRAKDFIGSDVITSTHFKNENISKVNIHGIETELDWNFNKNLSTFLNYTYNKSEIKEYSPDPKVEGNYLPRAPHQNISLGLTFKDPKLFDFTVLFDCKDKRFADNQNSLKMESYYTIDCSLSRSLSKNIKVYLDIENITNEKYTVYNSAMEHILAPGRIVLGKVKLTF